MNDRTIPQTMDKELEVLRNLYRENDLPQRDLAKIVGLSLGMTNAIVKRLAMKGLLTVRKVNNRNIKYVVSPAGVEEIAKRSYKYFKRTIKNIAHYKDQVEDLLVRVYSAGYRRVVLTGESDLDFIVEHLCRKVGLDFRRDLTGEENQGEEGFILHGESQATPGPAAGFKSHCSYLRDIVMA